MRRLVRIALHSIWFATGVLYSSVNAHAQGVLGVTVSAGRQNTTHGGEGTGSLFLGYAMVLTAGSGDKDKGFIASIGLGQRFYDLDPPALVRLPSPPRPDVIDVGSFRTWDFFVPVAIGARVRNASFGVAGEYRDTERDASDDRILPPGESSFDVGSTTLYMYGPFARVRLGSPNTLGAKFSIDARYLFGQGKMKPDQSLVVGDYSAVDGIDVESPRIVRAGVTFATKPRGILFRLEYERVQAKAIAERTFLPSQLDIKQEILAFSVGFVI